MTCQTVLTGIYLSRPPTTSDFQISAKSRLDYKNPEKIESLVCNFSLPKFRSESDFYTQICRIFHNSRKFHSPPFQKLSPFTMINKCSNDVLC